MQEELKRNLRECEDALYTDNLRLKRLEEKVMSANDSEVEGIICEIMALREKIEKEAKACMTARLKYTRADIDDQLMHMTP